MFRRFLSTATQTATKTAAKTASKTSTSVQSGTIKSTANMTLASDACEVVSSEHIPQAPNRDTVWSPSQRSREDIVYNDFRFVGKDLSKQPQPLAAIDLISKVPVIQVSSNIAVCHGTDFEQGHPKVYINLDKPGPHACGYCGLRYELDPNHHH